MRNARRMDWCIAAATIAAITGGAGTAAGQQFVEIFPTGGHQANNTVPFSVGGGGLGVTMHQVFASTLFSNLSAGQPVTIDRVAFTGQVTGHMVLSLGYTNAVPSSTLLTPNPAGGGAPNASGAVHVFFEDDLVAYGTTSTSFDMIFNGAPFVYDPSQGNLLLEVHMPVRVSGTSSSRGPSGTAESSRTYQVHGGSSGGSNQASRIEFTFTVGGSCYPDCDGDGSLTLADFGCFQTQFALGNLQSDCDGDGVLTLADFGCFQTAYALGCP